MATAAYWAAATGNERVPVVVEWLCGVGFATSLSSWVMKDALRRKQRPCYDYDTFGFSAWVFVVPVYLFQSRGLEALITLGWFALLVATAMFAGAATGILFGADR